MLLDTMRGNYTSEELAIIRQYLDNPQFVEEISARAARLAEERQQQALAKKRFESYRFEPVRYVKEIFGWDAWSGVGMPGQREILESYALSLRQQHERYLYENGRIPATSLKTWQPGQTICDWISIDSGHTTGKTKLAAWIVNHFFDCFPPSVIYTYAPTAVQGRDLLWKEIIVDRSGKGLPGRILPGALRLEGYSANHFARFKATDNSSGSGSERSQGQHEKFQLFVIDEAEGVPDFIFKAIETMMDGGVASLCVVIRNPRTRTCYAHKIRQLPNVKTFTLSCLDHPNVVYGQEIVPNAVTRSFITKMLKYSEVVAEHDPDRFTFELPWHEPGRIYRPFHEFLWRVLGVASMTDSDNTFCPVGRYEQAKNNDPDQVDHNDDPTIGRIGIDGARYGQDRGTLYVRWNGRVWRSKVIAQQDGYAYYIAAKEAALDLLQKGVRNIAFRADGGGGWCSTAVDLLRRDIDLIDQFVDFQVIEVMNNSNAYDYKNFADLVTEMYYHTGEALRVLSLINPPDELESDLVDRTFTYVKSKGYDVKRIVSKETFLAERKKKGINRSPDDGDGCCLAIAPDYIFGSDYKWAR